MVQVNYIHHVAISCTDYQKSEYFYAQILGFYQKHIVLKVSIIS